MTNLSPHVYVYICLQVAQKTQQDNLKRTDAILEVYTDRFVEKCHGSEDLALLWVLQQDLTEFSVSENQRILVTSHSI